MSLLEVSDLTVKRAGIAVIRGVSVAAEAGQISVLLGANGAGKTTLLEGISGIVSVTSGCIALDAADLSYANPGERARAGLAHIEQGRTVFAQLTTDENLRVSMNPETGLEDAYALFPELRQRSGVAAGMLSGGEQQMLVIARALLARPRVLMIDEMSAGLAPVIVSRLMKAVRRLADEGMAVLLVEQFAALALAIGDRAYVLRRGDVVYEGECGPLARDPERLHHLYLGDAPAGQT
jgi:branched-chain amino acid transport system ATP-binding protein